MNLSILALLCVAPAHAITFDWATIGNPGNAGDIHGADHGGVDCGDFGTTGVGFRVAMVPEPSTLLIGTLAAVGQFLLRRTA